MQTKSGKNIGLLIAALFTILFTVALFAQDTNSLPAQGDTNSLPGITIPDELLKTEIRDWKINGALLVLAVLVIGRLIKALSAGGGFMGVFKGIVSGTNTPPLKTVSGEKVVVTEPPSLPPN